MNVKIAWGRLVQSGLYRATRYVVATLAAAFVVRWVGAGVALDLDVLGDVLRDMWDDEGATVVVGAAVILGIRVGLDPVNRIPSLRESPIPVDQPAAPNTVSAPGYAPGTGV